MTFTLTTDIVFLRKQIDIKKTSDISARGCDFRICKAT